MLTTNAPSVTEGDAGAKALTFTLTLNRAPAEAVTVNYQTLSSGTATPGNDFGVAAGTVTFAAGQTTATVSVNVLGDTAVEANETVQVQFSGARLVASVTATGTITNDDTANAPIGAVSDSNAATNSVAENAAVGAVVGITASATDATAGETVSYALTTNPGDLFAIDATTGVVTVNGALDFETAASHSITVTAVSSDGSVSSQAFTIAVTDVAESVGAVSDSNAAANSVAENAVVGTVVGITASATDPQAGDTVSYALTTNPGNLFAIDAATGVVTVNGALDFETAASHSITVQATSSDGSTSTKDFTVAVTDVAEAQTFTLTADVDAGAAFTGGDGNDTFNAALALDPTTGAYTIETLTSFDYLRGGKGDADKLNVWSKDSPGYTVPTSVEVDGIEIVEFRSEGILTADVDGWTGLTKLNSTYSDTEVNFTASSLTYVTVSGAAGTKVTVVGGATQTVTSGDTIDLSYAAGAVSVSGVTGDVEIDHGTTVDVTDSVSGNNITIGSMGGFPSGAVTVNDWWLNQGTIAVDGGSDVSITASKVTTGGVTVGATGAATGAVSVTTTGEAFDGKAGNALGAIAVTGGTSVTVAVTATSSSAKAATLKNDTNNLAVTQGAITVTGDDNTTAVSVSQDADVAAVDQVVAVSATAGVNQIDKVTFVAMAAGETITVGNLTFEANVALTAAQAAAAFANLAAGATHGSASASQGTYSGTFGAYSTGAVTTANNASSVRATASAASNGIVPIGVADTAAAGNVAATNTTAGVTAVPAVAAVTGVLGVVAGKVTIAGEDALTTVSIDGFGAGSTVASDGLTSLTLANSVNDLKVSNATATTLALGLNNIGTGAIIDLDGAKNSGYTTLNITTSGTASAIDLTADTVKTLTVAGDKALELTATKLAAVETVTVSGSVGLTLDASALAKVTAISTAATTGNSTITIDASKASFTGGDGKDTVTVSSTTVDEDIALGKGDETLTLASGTTAITATVDGGDGTDTLAVDAADAAALSAADLSDELAGFEKLSIGVVAAGATATIDMANLDDIDHVISAGAATGGGVPAQAVYELDLAGLSLNQGDTLTIAGVQVASNPFANALADTVVAFNLGGSIVQIGTIIYTISTTGPTTIIFTEVVASNDPIVAGDGFQVTVTGGGGSTPPTSTLAAQTVAGSIGAVAGVLAITNMADNGTLELTAAGAGVTVTMEDATGAADRFNIVTKVSAANLNFGTVDVAGVETLTITATDTKGAANTATLTVVDAAVKAITVTGTGNLDLTAAGAALKTVDASVLSGDLTFTSAVNSVTITGGSGDDVITVTGNFARLTGGGGADVFDISDATSSVQTYSTITDLAVGDGIKFDAAIAFNATAIALNDTASFADYANEAILTSGDGEVSWFQFGGNTYAVENIDVDGNSNTADVGEVTFTNGQDVIVRITGLVDLSDSALSSGLHTLYVV